MSKEERRYNKWKQIDPYPNIDPALLNSADIQAYIEKVAMVSPFYPENLKGASYDVAIKGKWFIGMKRVKKRKKIYCVRAIALIYLQIQSRLLRWNRNLEYHIILLCDLI